MAGITEAAFTGLGAVSQAKSSFVDPIVKSFTASNNMTKIQENLNHEFTKLCFLKDDLEGMLQRERTTHISSKAYDNWSQNVTRIEEDMENINDLYKLKSKKSKVKFVSRSNFSEKMMKKLAEVSKLLEDGAQLGTILVPKKHEQVVEMLATNITEFPTLQKPLEEILDCLAMKKIKGIRVHGSMGVGKTTILENLNNHNKVAQMFEIVMFLKVSVEENKKNFTTEEIQEAIVQRLKLNVEGIIGCDNVSRRIREELNDKKFLLLLDDVKEDLDLNKIGICPNYETGSKIVLATRFGRVCSLIVSRSIKVERLSSKEAKKMFRKILDHSKHKVGSIMTQVVEFCDGLPFAIKMIASSFKMRDTDEQWSDGLEKLKQWPEKQDIAMKELCRLLDFCCDHLEGNKKECFLYTALYSEDGDIHIDNLLDCWEAEEFENYASDPSKSRANGRNILDDLKMVCLLEKGGDNNHVKMQKMIRQIARYKLSHEIFLVKTNESLKEAPNLLLWKQKKWISLVGNKFETVPEVRECSTLSTLFLHKNSSLKKLPTLFFKEMRNLRVLSLYGTAISLLPSSLSELTLLKVLYLNSCTRLEELLSDDIHKLSNLQVLDIRDTKVKIIALHVEKLKHLKRLLLSLDTHEVSAFCEVIPKISSTIEELVIDVKSCKGDCIKIINSIRDKVSTSLKNLMTLKFRFEDGIVDVIKVVAGAPVTYYYPIADDLTSFVTEMNASRLYGSFQVFIGCSISSSPQIQNLSKYDNYLKYCDGKGFNQNITKVLMKTDAFVLINHGDLERISNFEASILSHIRGFLIESCDNVTEFIDGTVDGPVLENLLRLYTKKLPKLKSLWNSHVDLRTLSRLKTLEIGECSVVEILIIDNRSTGILPCLAKLVVYDMPNLVKVCTNSALQWPALKKFKMRNCPNLDELPFEKDNAAKLKKLVLLDLPKLTKICTSRSFECHALEKLKIHGCPDLKKLPFDVSNTKKLMYIEGEKEWWEMLQWQDPKTKKLLQPFCHLS